MVGTPKRCRHPAATTELAIERNYPLLPIILLSPKSVGSPQTARNLFFSSHRNSHVPFSVSSQYSRDTHVRFESTTLPSARLGFLFRRCAILLYHSPFDLRAQIELQYQVSMEISPDSIMTSARPAYDRNFLEVDAFHRACPVVSH